MAGSAVITTSRSSAVMKNATAVRWEGVFERRAYQEHPPRHEYLLTAKGRDLLPVVVALGVWGLRWTDAQAPPARASKRTTVEIMAALRASTGVDRAESGEGHADEAGTPLPAPKSGAARSGATPG